METLKDLEPYVDSTVFHFCSRMREKMVGGAEIDLGKWFQLFAFGKSWPLSSVFDGSLVDGKGEVRGNEKSEAESRNNGREREGKTSAISANQQPPTRCHWRNHLF